MSDRYDYQPITDVAHSLIYKYGSAITLTRTFDPTVWIQKFDPVESVYYWQNIATGVKTTTQPSITYTGQGVITRFTVEEISTAADKILATDRKLLIYDIPEPKADDIFTVAGIDYKCISFSAIEPAGTAIVYKVQVRV